MTLASLIALFLSRRLGVRTRLTAATEATIVGLGDPRRVLHGVSLITLMVESAVATVLTLRFRATYDDTWSTPTWHGVFHAISAFNNAGFALFSDNHMGFQPTTSCSSRSRSRPSSVVWVPGARRGPAHPSGPPVAACTPRTV